MKKIIKSFKYAIEGIIQGIKDEQNMKIHIFIMALVIIFGIMLKISEIEWMVCIILFALVISLELVNTAIENIVDLITLEKKEKAKKSKRYCSRSCFNICHNVCNYWDNYIST